MMSAIAPSRIVPRSLKPAQKAGSGYFALIVLMLAAICLFLAFAFPTFSGIMGLVMQDAAGG